MNTSDPLHHLGSILYHSGPLEVPYFPNQFLGMDFFLQPFHTALDGLGFTLETISWLNDNSGGNPYT